MQGEGVQLVGQWRKRLKRWLEVRLTKELWLSTVVPYLPRFGYKTSAATPS